MTDFFIADTHFGHRKIIQFCADSRPFDTIEEHDNALIDNWNSVVTEEDTVYVLGDFFLGGYKRTDRIKEILSLLKGKKILIQGNHDLDKTSSHWISLGFDKVLPMAVYKGCLLTHIPIDSGEIRGQSKRGRFLANIHGHLHDEGNTPDLNFSGRFCVSAEAVELTPISWDALWKSICKVGGKYLPLEDADYVTFTGEGTVDMARFDVTGKRMRGELVSINSKYAYKLVAKEVDGVIGILSLEGTIFFVKPKNFIGVVTTVNGEKEE